MRNETHKQEIQGQLNLHNGTDTNPEPDKTSQPNNKTGSDDRIIAPFSFNLDITEQQARDTIWTAPYPEECNGKPMGPLVDDKKLTLTNLRYGIEQIYDKKQKKASTYFMLKQLAQKIS